MTIDFEGPNRVMWFSGEQFEEGAEARGRNKALLVLRSAISNCRDCDMREDALTLAAISYLQKHLDKIVLATNFLIALNEANPQLRQLKANAAYALIERATRSQIRRNIKSI